MNLSERDLFQPCMGFDRQSIYPHNYAATQRYFLLWALALSSCLLVMVINLQIG